MSNLPPPTASDSRKISAPSATVFAQLEEARVRSTGYVAPALHPALNSGEASRVRNALPCFRRYEAPLLQWMSQSPANARLFARDPFGALASSDLAVPADVLAELRALSILIVNVGGD